MLHGSVLQMANGEPDLSSSIATYTACVPEWGFPAIHTQLLQELKGWMARDPAVPHQPRVALERVFEVEGNLLMDASVAGLAAEHLPFLYTVLGEVFAELGPQFRRALHRQAARVEKAHEDEIRQQMGESGTDDRLEAVYALENIALQRLQERQEHVLLLLEGLGEDEIAALFPEAPGRTTPRSWLGKWCGPRRKISSKVLVFVRQWLQGISGDQWWLVTGGSTEPAQDLSPTPMSFAATHDPLAGMEWRPKLKEKPMMVQAGDEGLIAAALWGALAASSPHQQGHLTAPPLHPCAPHPACLLPCVGRRARGGRGLC